MTPVEFFAILLPSSKCSRLKEYLISNQTRLNEQIRAQSLRVIDEEGQQLGVMSRDEALQTAKDQGLDLVEISPNAQPPVAKIVDWGKYSYKRTKQLQKQKRLAKNPGLKQMRSGLKIGEHDLGVKLRKVSEFLEAGHKVKITLFYRGREIAHKDIGFNLAEKIINQLSEIAVVEQTPQLMGKQLSFVLRSKPNAKAKDAQRDQEPDQDNQER